jgi:hypothetical protein
MKFRVASVNTWLGFLLAAAFGVGLSSSTLAQGRPPGAGPPGDINPIRADRARVLEESKLRRAEINVSDDGEREKRFEAAIVTIKDDFTRIQVLRNDIARNLIARKPLNYKLVSEQTAEINKRATDLNVYMLARVPEEKEETKSPDVGSEEMINALVSLCKLIDSFTENPALKNATTVEIDKIEKAREDKVKADRDLIGIIKLSAIIQKRSNSLRTLR